MRLVAAKPVKGIFITLIALSAITFSCDVAAPSRPEKVYISEPGRFEVIFPGEPKVEITTAEIDSETISLNTYAAETSRPTAKYSVNYFDISGGLETSAEIFDSLGEGLEEIKGQELDRKDMLFEGHPSRVIRAVTPDGSFIKVHFIHTGRRIYQMMAYFPSEGRSAEETSRDSEPLADRFFNSFKLSSS